MTVFVVSLFLPNTINFKLPSTNSRPPTRSNLHPDAGKLDASRPGRPVFFAQHKDITPPATPIHDVDHEQFFAQTEIPNPKASLPIQEDQKSLIAPSDPHSPAWGAGKMFNQPRSRASSPPPADILKHNKMKEKAELLGSAGIRQPQFKRSDSHDRVFAHAEWEVEPAEQGNGGLRNAVQAAVRSGNLEEKIWVGTLGMPTDALLKDSDFDGHYTHYCKQILWPVFHYQIPDNPKSKAYEDHSWIYYVKVNQAFADKIVKEWKRGDVIWIHDYHLLLVPSMIRKKLPDAKIGFFLHVAFPSSEVFRCLAVRKELLEGMLGANLIGFQIQEYGRHFLQTCSRILMVEATNDGIQLEDRFIDVINLAIGIDPVALDMNREDPKATHWLNTMQERYRGKKLIVARDKLDHVRGVRPKLLAYELFLNKYPEWRDKVVLIQVATSTTENAELDATVSDIVTRINSSWANLAYQPVVYLKQDIIYAQYLALLTVADALMIASQREALEMEDEEKEERFKKLHAAVMHHTAEHWFNEFLHRLDKVYDEQHRRDTTSVPRLSINMLGQKYQKSERRLFIIDYEGTLASWGSPSSIILTSPQRTIDTLNDILQDEENTVYVMSSRQPEELDRLFKRVPRLGLIAENGCFLKTIWNFRMDRDG
ncbi:hypothetical protein DID88_004038 [Monilinia fructigena]|uniref:Uncharacterized protein n=1 Tax=Monilinia fructigena TaxID=38457 RepID=A0A395IX82_9HELO|nr:hypothetical protein DID88_004038 [Monilinia fructigena]